MNSDRVGELHPLAMPERPLFEAWADPLAVVDLFAGCGGLTLGLAQAAQTLGRGLHVRLAVEIDESPAEVYRTNFPNTDTIVVEDITTIFTSELDQPLSKAEEKLRRQVGKVDVIVGGPPCQGHSNLNNHTRRDDPKNALYAVMARAAHVLAPDVMVVENVPAVLNDKHNGSNVVSVVRDKLRTLGYDVSDRVMSLYQLGVPQRRKRHVLLATRLDGKNPEQILDQLAVNTFEAVDLRWAIGDLVEWTSDNLFDRAPTPSSDNLKRMQYLLRNNAYDLPNYLRPQCHQGEHTYKSMYGRLNWNLPAQTITSGFGSIGQGRYMHPELPRALTPHEAARIQGFPDYFDFGSVGTRGALAKMIGNAVPPQLSRELLLGVLANGAEG